jgi:hypothetical protein
MRQKKEHDESATFIKKMKKNTKIRKYTTVTEGSTYYFLSGFKDSQLAKPDGMDKMG